MGLKMWAPTILVLGALAGCGGSDGGTGGDAPTTAAAANGALGEAPPASASATAQTPPVTTSTAGKPPASAGPQGPAAPLTCDALKNSTLDSAAADALNYPQEINLVNGAWSGDELSVTLRECGIGDLDGDGNADGVASLVFNSGGTGQFYYLGYWHNVGGQPVYESAVDLGDRNPVESIAIAGGKATVVVLTRTPDLPPAATNIRRTATYKLSDSTLTEQGHTDAPYTP